MNIKYIFLFICLILVVYLYNSISINEKYTEFTEEEEEILKKINKRLVTEDDLFKADIYAMKKLCALKNYGFDTKLYTCTHRSEKTCLEDHPGTAANPEDIQKLEKIKNTGCAPQIASFEKNIIRSGVGEWYESTKEDKEFVKKQKIKVDELKKIWEKNGKKQNQMIILTI